MNTTLKRFIKLSHLLDVICNTLVRKRVFSCIGYVSISLFEKRVSIPDPLPRYVVSSYLLFGGLKYGVVSVNETNREVEEKHIKEETFSRLIIITILGMSCQLFLLNYSITRNTQKVTKATQRIKSFEVPHGQ